MITFVRHQPSDMKRIYIIYLIIVLTSAGTFAQTSLLSNRVPLVWQLEYTLPGKSRPTVTSAVVPGAVQLDIARNEKYGNYYFAENWKDYLWMEDQAFTYRTRFSQPSTEPGERVYFYSGGIDYRFGITINGTKIHQQEGMFTPVKLDLTDYLQEQNVLEVRIEKVPKLHQQPADRSQAAASMKPPVSYSWDWHPRLIPSGIWKETYLEIMPSSFITEAQIHYTLNDQLTSAELEIDIRGTKLAGNEIIWKIRDNNDQVVASKILKPTSDQLKISASMAQINLWWPHDQGEPYLYASALELRDSDNELLQMLVENIGFRRVRLVMNEGAWKEPQGFPKSRSVAPAQVEINGRKVFAKGTNWVNPEIFPGIITEERYDELTDRAVEANFNMLRVWGGGIVNKEAFYQQCDQKGLMVWQEFPLACNKYPDTPEFLDVLTKEATSIIKMLRNHPCITIWSGGNELFNSWSGMTDQSIALRTLNSLTLELDPNTPYINTSPLMGMGHGHYVFRDMDTGEEVYSLMTRAHNTAYTEFGVPSPSSVAVLRTIIPQEELWPPRPGTSWESHHAFNAWVGNTWLMQDMIEDYFGEVRTLQDLVNHGQLLQAEGYKAIYEEARRQKPYCSMALNWCFNEPWPTAANNSLINWPNIPKPAFSAVSNSCRPVLASARIEKLQWREGEIFETDIYLLNDRFRQIPPGRITVKLIAGDQSLEILSWDHPGTGPNENLVGPSARVVLPHWDTDRFQLVLEVNGKPEQNSSYTLLYKPSRTQNQSRIMNR